MFKIKNKNFRIFKLNRKCNKRKINSKRILLKNSKKHL
jgi:hypothetical protein